VNETHLQYLASPEWAARLEADLLPWIDRVGDLGDDVLEIGPGPGLTTDILRSRAAVVTAVEIDHALATALADRMDRTNVEVLEGDASAMNFDSDRFTAATAFSVLHHVPSPAKQDQILREVHRVLAPGGHLVATDARDVDFLREAHQDDTFVPLPTDTLVARLEAAGFGDVELKVADYEIRFAARKPL
jgi:ubiquinone/menaquinone biosynthesis C-methylase UbiE